MEASPICRGKNLTLETVMAFVNAMPKEHMPKKEFHAFAERRLKGWTQTHSQIARQLALYYEEDGECIPRFCSQTTSSIVFEYIKHWATLYYVPNLYTPSLIGYNPTNIYAFLRNKFDKGESSFSKACFDLFGIPLNNTDKVRVYLNNFTDLIIEEDQMTRNMGIVEIEYPPINPQIDNIKSAKDFYYYFGDTIIAQPNKHSQYNISNPLQQIFYGAPGTGKSHTINEITELQPKENVFRTTFHPDSDYSTFVGCYKPTKENATTQNQQSILDYDTLVDKFKEYLGVKDPYQNITRACTLFGYDFHDSIVRMQESNTHTIPELVADAYKSGTTYDSQVRAGMACYEESVKPQISSSKITYSFVPQSFTKAYLRAWQTEEPVYLVIEEINRGNCAQIFGDLFQLLDRKNGVSEYPIKADNDLAIYIGEELAKKSRENIPENVKSGEELVLPSNLYIWATMNTSDQSLFPIDSAFKRRWDWTYIPIDTTKESWNINADGVNYDWSDFLEKINAKIESATSSEDKMLGFYFCKAENDVITAERFVNKVVFYLWNDVFKDYGFDDAVFNDENNKKITFRMFYKADGKVDESMVKRFLENLGVKNDKTPKSETQE